MKKLLVRDLMTRDPYTVTPDASLKRLQDLMDEGHLRHVPVVDEEENLVGLVTHRDVLRGLPDQVKEMPLSYQREHLARTPVDELMNKSVETTEPETPLIEAAQVMLENKFGCLPVVEGSRLVGILTESDFVRWVAEVDTRD